MEVQDKINPYIFGFKLIMLYICNMIEEKINGTRLPEGLIQEELGYITKEDLDYIDKMTSKVTEYVNDKFMHCIVFGTSGEYTNEELDELIKLFEDE